MTSRAGFDPASLVAGVILIALGGLLLLDQADVLELRFAYMLPAVLAAVGGILLACGLTGPPRGRG
jgi:uncharacterized membrane protein